MSALTLYPSGAAPTADQLAALRGLTAPAVAALAAQTNSANSDLYMIASNRMNFPVGNSAIDPAANTQIVSATVHQCPPYRTFGHRFCFVGFWISSTDNVEKPASSVTHYSGVAIEVNGVRTVLTVNGQQAFDVPIGGYVWTDANDAIVLAPNQMFRQIVWSVGASGDYRMQSLPCSTVSGLGPQGVAGALVDGLVFGTSDMTTPFATGPLNTLPAAYTSPAAAMIVAKGWSAANAVQKRPVVLVKGDSIPEGTGDQATVLPFFGSLGGLARGLTDRRNSEFVPHQMQCKFGAPFDNATLSAKRNAVLASMNYPFTTILSEYGGNNSDVVTAYPPYVLYCKTLGNRKFVQQTLLPCKSDLTTANIGATTFANQIQRDTRAQSINPIIRYGKTPGQDDYIEDAGIVDGARGQADDYAWKIGPNGTLKADFTANSSTAVLDFAPGIGDLLAIASGTASYSLTGAVLSVAPNTPVLGQYTVVFTNVGSNANTSGSTVNVQYTTDRTHPCPSGHIAIGAMVERNKSKLINSAM